MGKEPMGPAVADPPTGFREVSAPHPTGLFRVRQTGGKPMWTTAQGERIVGFKRETFLLLSKTTKSHI